MRHLFTKSICLLAVLFHTTPLFGRVVIAESTGEPIVFASVGIINRNLGTLTDSLGRFTLSVPADYINDTLKISSVGYRPRVFAVKDFRNIPDTIVLADDIISLSEVVVKPQKIEHKTAGRRSSGGFIFINVEGYKAAGQGLAIPLNIDKRAWIKGLGFTIVTEGRPLSHMKFRVNFYEKINGDYNIMASVKQIYFDYDKHDLSNGHFHFDFPEEIMLDKGEYYAELEFLENFKNEFFIMKSKPLSGKTRYRYASQSAWETLPFGCTLYFEYDNVK